MRDIPSARHIVDMLALKLGVPPPVATCFMLTEDEREIVPWHRVVAKGGAIGRGPLRDRQFARLSEEGIVRPQSCRICRA